jgi:caffeoyl-CoA O-methyltransferase
MNTEEYILKHSDREPELLEAINRRTHVQLLNPRMLSGHYQGRVLAMFCKMIQPARILELGTFTGYSALCMAESLPENGELITIESDDELEDFIRENFARSEYGNKIQLLTGEALKIIPQLTGEFDIVFVDADKREYSAYYDAVFPKVQKGGYIIADNTLWDGKVLKTPETNDHQTIEIMKFNDMIAADTRVEKVILPLRDGLTIIRKK